MGYTPYALSFNRYFPGEIGPLIDVTHCSVNDYLDEDAENFPQNWPEYDISGKEIVAITLNFKVNKE